MATPFPRYTVDMLDALPDHPGVRYELVDGILLVTPAPGSAHGVLTGRLVAALHALIPERVAYVATPGKVCVGTDTRLVPDVLVYPGTFPPGTPWTEVSGWLLAIEVVSPSSAVYDRDHKRRAYLAIGVREYWVVDLAARTVEVWRADRAAPEIERGQVAVRGNEGRVLGSVDVERLFRDVPSFAND